jgi:hypothetical protein
MKNPVYTYNFQTSQPLTQTQIDWFNNQLWENLPTENDLEDIPEWTTEIKLVNVEELID